MQSHTCATLTVNTLFFYIFSKSFIFQFDTLHKIQAMHDFMSDPYIFSEFINLFVFNGKTVLTAQDLSNEDSTLSQVIDAKENTGADAAVNAVNIERYRDIIKKAILQNHFILLAIENQTNISMIMPVKNALYDLLNYQSQIKAFQHKNKIIKCIFYRHNHRYIRLIFNCK